MGALVLDASLVIAYSEPGDPLHARAVEETAKRAIPGTALLLPASAYSELLVNFS